MCAFERAQLGGRADLLAADFAGVETDALAEMGLAVASGGGIAALGR